MIGDKNFFSKELKNFIGSNKSLVEIGSGTCQLSNYLAIGNNNQICAFDSSLTSLSIGKNFSDKNDKKDFDKAAEDLRLATRQLGMIVGKVDVEEILGSIFNDFCIGK